LYWMKRLRTKKTEISIDAINHIAHKWRTLLLIFYLIMSTVTTKIIRIHFNRFFAWQKINSISFRTKKMNQVIIFAGNIH
jgi:hypothetical protein